MTAGQLDQLALAWEIWAAEPPTPARKIARAKLHLLFLLIRFGGLRLIEACNLDLRRDLDVETGMIHVPGTYRRNVLLPLYCMRPIRGILSLPEAGNPGFIQLDPGFSRRTFYAVAATVGIDSSEAGPRALRYQRGYELLSLHVPLKLVQDYLGLARPGQIAAFLKFANPKLQEHAKNCFTGIVTDIQAGMRSAVIKLKTFSGLILSSFSDMQSLMRLEPRPGLVAEAFIVPGQIMLAHRGVNLPFANCLQGHLSSLFADEVESFAVIELADKNLIHADIEAILLKGLDLKPGVEVNILFPARAVQLRLA